MAGDAAVPTLWHEAVLGPTCVYGARPVATSTASTSSSSTFSLVLKSVSSTTTGFTPGTPAQPMDPHSQKLLMFHEN